MKNDSPRQRKKCKNEIFIFNIFQFFNKFCGHKTKVGTLWFLHFSYRYVCLDISRVSSSIFVFELR